MPSVNNFQKYILLTNNFVSNWPLELGYLSKRSNLKQINLLAHYNVENSTPMITNFVTGPIVWGVYSRSWGVSPDNLRNSWNSYFYQNKSGFYEGDC